MNHLRIELQSQPIRKPREIIKNTHDMRHLQDRRIVKPKIAQRLPVTLTHTRGLRAHLLGHLTQRAIALGQTLKFAPRLVLHRLNQLRITFLDTQKLCVSGRSVEAILRGRRNARDHFTFPPR